MSGQTIRTMIGIARRGVVSGVLTFAGVSVAVDNPGWVGYAAAGVTALVLTFRTAGAAQVAGDRERLFRDQDNADRPNRDYRPLDAVAQSRTVSIETTRDIRADGPSPVRSARVGVLMADDRHHTENAYLTTGTLTVPPDDLATLEYDRAGGRQWKDHPGSVRLGDQLPPRSEPTRFPLLADVPQTRRFAASPSRRGRGRAAIAAWCAAFVIAGTATGVLMPDTSAVGELAHTVIGEISGASIIDDPNGQLRDLLAAAEQAVPGSTGYVRTVSLSEHSASITVHDPDRSRDFTVTDSGGDPDYDSGMTASRGTFALAADSLPDIRSVLDRAVVALGEDAAAEPDTVEIERPSETAEPLLTARMQVTGGYRDLQATMTGELAPVFQPQDVAASYARIGELLKSQGIGAGDRVIHRLVIQSTADGAATLRTSDIQNDGGILVEIVRSERDAPTVYQVPGQFPVLDAGTSSPDNSEALFSLNDVSIEQIRRLVQQNAETSGAERADLAGISLTVDAGSAARESDQQPPSVAQAPPQLRMQLGSLERSDQTYPLTGK